MINYVIIDLFYCWNTSGSSVNIMRKSDRYYDKINPLGRRLCKDEIVSLRFITSVAKNKVFPDRYTYHPYLTSNINSTYDIIL